jgi:hypothetical protein
VRLNDFYDGFVQPKSLSAMTKDSHRILSSPRIPEEIIKPHKSVLSSSREIVPLKMFFLIAGHTEFYCGSNEPSHAS